jgi:hypothetical protein
MSSLYAFSLPVIFDRLMLTQFVITTALIHLNELVEGN